MDLTGDSFEDKLRRFSTVDVQKLPFTPKPPPNKKPKEIMRELQLTHEVKKDLLDQAEHKLKDPCDNTDFDGDEVDYLWVHYRRVCKTFIDAPIKLSESELKENKNSKVWGSMDEIHAFERDHYITLTKST